METTTTQKRPSSNIEIARKRLRDVRTRLMARFVGREEAIDGLLWAAVAREPVLFIGAPGSAKSALVTSFCELLGLSTAAGAAESPLFSYQLTEFTVPEELFGYPDLRAFELTGELVRQDQHMVQKAEVVFLDEVLNGSSALLNSLLALLNERCYYDRGQRKPARYRLMLGATQHPPQRPELAALYDRFTIRAATHWVDDGNQSAMVARSLGQVQRESPVASLSDVDLLAEACAHRCKALAEDGSFLESRGLARYLRLVRHVRRLGATLSDRRVVKLLRVLVARSVLDDCAPFDDAGLWVMRYALNHPADGASRELLERAVFSELEEA